MAIEAAAGFGGKQGPARDLGNSQVLLHPVWLSIALTGFSIKLSASLLLSFPGQRFGGQPETPSHCSRGTDALIPVFGSDHRLKLDCFLSWLRL